MLQRTFVHNRAMPEGGEAYPLRFEPTPTLVLKMGARVWWITDAENAPEPVNPRNLRVCMAVNCSVDGCTRAKSLEPFKADAGTEREQAAVLDAYRDTDTRIANLAFELERLEMAPPSGEPKAVLDHVHALALELRSRRNEQGELRDHVSDAPISRIRSWMWENYPYERTHIQLSKWVIGKLAAGKLAEAELSFIVEYVFEAFPSERATMAADGAATTIHRLFSRFGRALEANGLTIEGTPEPDGHATYLTMLRKEGQIKDPAKADEPLQAQIDRLADYILAEIPGEPSQNEGAIDTAIRVLREQKRQTDENLEDIGRLTGYLRREWHDARETVPPSERSVDTAMRLLRRYRELQALLHKQAMLHGEPWTSFVDNMGAKRPLL